MSTDKGLFPSEFLSRLKIPIAFVLAMWIFHLINFFTAGSLKVYGILPRTLEGLIGIVMAPFIHGSFQHLFSNTIPIFFLLSVLFLLYKRIAWQAFLALYFCTDILVWLFARPAYHIGASGIVYALVSFLFWTGLFRRNMRAIAISLVILVLYSGYFMGIIPDDPHISWESHLLGAITGIIIAYTFKDVLEEDEEKKDKDDHDEHRHAYFDSDTFTYTKAEREAMRRGGSNWYSPPSW